MGYIGYERSVRSQEAISEFEVPLNHINRTLISDFIEEKQDYQFLEKVSVSLVKFTAKKLGPSSWHHVSSYYNEVDHFSLEEVAGDLQENLKERTEEFKQSKQNQEQSDINYIVVAKIQIWGGSRNKPRIMGHEMVLGLEKNGWLYPVSKSEQSKYKLSANKIEDADYFKLDNYADVVKKFPEFKAIKRQINAKKKELGGIKK